MPNDVISLIESGRLYCPSHSTSPSISIDSMTTRSNLKSTDPKAKLRYYYPHYYIDFNKALNYICTHLVGTQEARNPETMGSDIPVRTPSNHLIFSEIERRILEHSTRPSKFLLPSNFNKASAEDIRTPSIISKKSAST
jgi:hypothetical protein